MDKCSLADVCTDLTEKYNAKEITIGEFLSKSTCICEDTYKSLSKVYKIEDESVIQSLLSESEKKEILIAIQYLEKNNPVEDYKDECSEYMKMISTGKLIIIGLQSADNNKLSGFIMEGCGEKLYNYLLSFIDGKVEKASNSLEETITELEQFRPYGKIL